MFKIKKNDINKVLNICVLLSICILILRKVCPINVISMSQRIFLGQVGNIAVLIVDIIVFCVLYKCNVKDFLKLFKSIVKSNKFILTTLLVYLIWELVTLIYTDDKTYSLNKYVELVQVIFITINICYLSVAIDSKRIITNIMITISITMYISIIVAWIGYLTNTYTVYIVRLSTVADYNTFADSCLIGYVTSIFLLSYLKLSKKWCFYIMLFVLPIYIATIYVSSSRRAILLLFIVTVVVAVLVVKGSLYKYTNSGVGVVKRLLLVILMLVLLSGIAIAIIRGFNSISTYDYEQRSTVAIQKGDFEKVAGSNTSARLKTIEYNNGGFESRIVIWKCTINWIKDLKLTELVFGRGQSYSYQIYEMNSKNNKELLTYCKNVDFPKASMSPHNLFLTDILQGGLIKLLLSAFIMILALYKTVYIIRNNSELGWYIMLLLGIEFCILMLGAKFGILGDYLTWLDLGFIIIVSKDISDTPLQDMDNN